MLIKIAKIATITSNSISENLHLDVFEVLRVSDCKTLSPSLT